jgi:hypothetical protein
MTISIPFTSNYPSTRLLVTTVSLTDVPDNLFTGNADYSQSFKDHYTRISLNNGAFQGYINKDLAGIIAPNHLYDIWYDIESGFYVKILMALRLDLH